MKTEEIIAKFENGKDRYTTDPYFRACIESLSRGADPIELLDHLLTTNKTTIDQHIEFVMNDCRPPKIEITSGQADNFLIDQAASLRKELEDYKEIMANHHEIITALQIQYGEARAKSEKLLEALNVASRYVSSIRDKIDWEEIQQAISEYEKGGSDATKD